MSLGFDSGGKPLRRKVSGKTKTEIKDELRELHSDLEAGVRTSASYNPAPAQLLSKPLATAVHDVAGPVGDAEAGSKHET